MHEALQGPDRWWRETLLRVAVLLALAWVVEWTLYGRALGAVGAHPHPYWLLVLPLAAARGLVAGLVAAGVASGFVFLGAALSHDAAVGLGGALVAAASEPLLFLTAAVLVGELRDVLRAELRESEAERAGIAEELALARYERDVLESSARELERRLAYGPGDVGGLISAARRMELADLQGLYAVTLDLVLEHVGDAASVVEVERDGRLVLARAQGGRQGADRDLATLRVSPLVEAALRRGEPGNVFEFGADDLPKGPRMVAPLFDHTRSVSALLLLDELSPARLGPATFRTFVSLADWASSGIARLAHGAAPLAAPRGNAAARPGLSVRARLGSPEALEARIVREFARCERHALNLAVLGVQFSLESDRAETVLERLDGAVLELLGRGLRASDGLHAFGFPGCYAIVLAGTDLRGAAVVRARLEANALAVERRLGAAARLHAVGPEQGEVTPALALAALAERFRVDARRPLGIPERAPRDPREAGAVEDLVERIACEAVLERRFGLAFQLVEVALGAAHRSDESDAADAAAQVPAPVAAAAASALRSGAEAFAFGPGHFIYLLPGLGALVVASVLTRFEQALAAAGVEADVRRVFDSESGADIDLLVTTLRGGRVA